MPKRKSFTLDFKRSVLEWIYEDEDAPKSSYAAAEQLLWSNREITETNETELFQENEEDFDELDVVLDDAFEDLSISE